jgi:uncharacterized protein (DUF697 family)
MSDDLLQKLMAAQTDEERSWIVIENLLESLPKDVAMALWAVAIPHWFDAEILTALCPELADRADEIYQQLQDLSCVEVFPARGHNIHELTCNQLLDRLWQNDPERFRTLSGRAAVYFEKGDKPEIQIERIYHLVVIYPERGINELQNLAQKWNNTFRRTELEALFSNLQEQVNSNRTSTDVARRLQTTSSLLDILDSKSSSNDKTVNSSNRASTKRQAREKARLAIVSWSMAVPAMGWIPSSHAVMNGGYLAMLIDIGAIYDVHLDNSQAASVFNTIVAPLINRELIQVSALSFLPAFGWTVKLAVSARIALHIGEALIGHFDRLSNLPE